MESGVKIQVPKRSRSQLAATAQQFRAAARKTESRSTHYRMIAKAVLRAGKILQKRKEQPIIKDTVLYCQGT